MKKLISYLIIILSVTTVQSAYAQDRRAPVGCIDPSIRLQADAIKQHYTAQGFKVYRDAMINMESMVPFPIMVQLAAGHLYQIVFVGNSRATNHKMIIYDSRDRKLDESFVFKRHGQEVTNYMVFQFVPERSDTYLIEFMTRLKNENFCGSVCILAADASKGKVEYTPYVP